MIAAIYARKSTDQSDVSEDARSVTRQIDHARAFAVKHGWTVAEEHIFIERDGTSGAVFGEHRPGLLRLLNALETRAPFQALVMMEESRIGRESIETGYVIKQIIDAEVRCFTYLDGKERTLDNAMDKVMLHLVNFASEMEREKASQRTYDAMVRKARAQHVTGGRIYGYDNVAITSPEGQRLHVVRRVNDFEAGVLRRIFELYAGGLGLTGIAHTLNAEHVPPPRRDHQGWSPNALRDMIGRELYRGEIVWNRTQRIVRKGAKTAKARPESEWLRLDAPDLRIVSDELWTAAQQQRRAALTGFPRRPDGTFLGRPSGADRGSRYLLTGIAQCAACNGSLVGLKKSHGPWRKFLYGCGHHHRRGSAICTNGVEIRQTILDHAILDALAGILDERAVAAAIQRALERLRSGQERTLDRRTQIQRELSLIEAHERRLITAIKEGADPRPLAAELNAEEARKDVLVQELGELDHAASVASLEDKRLLREVEAQAADIKRLMLEHVAKARQMLRKLDVSVVCEPFEEKGQKGYRFTLTGTYMRILGSVNVGRSGWGRRATSSNGSTCCACSSRWGGT